MDNNLNKSIVKGALWMSALRSLYRIIGFISTMILARILTPHDFGVLSIAMSFYALLEIFSNTGMNTVLIKEKDISVDHYNTAWTLNVIINSLAAFFIAISAHLVANFYEIYDLEFILYICAVVFLLNGVKNIWVVDFQRDLTFDKEFKLLIIPKFLGFFITIGMALWLQNYWALIFSILFGRVIEVVTTYAMHRGRPKFSLLKISEIFLFSKWLVLNNIFSYINSRLPELILGKLTSTSTVATYSISLEISSTATTEIISNLNRALYPGYSKVSSSTSALTGLYINSMKVIAYIALPLGIGLVSVSSIMVPVVLGNQWLQVIEPLQCLALGGMILSMKSNAAYLYYVLSKPYLVTLDLLIRAVAFVIFIYVLFPKFGLMGITYAFLISSIISFVISAVIINKLLPVSLVGQFSLYLKPGIAALVMGYITNYFISFNIFSSLVELFLAVIVGVIVYILTIIVLWIITGRGKGPEEFVLRILKNKFFPPVDNI